MTQTLRIAVRDRSYIHGQSGHIYRTLWERSDLSPFVGAVTLIAPCGSGLRPR